eukprot:1690213-Pyramimonas_sp.AAC.2
MYYYWRAEDTTYFVLQCVWQSNWNYHRSGHDPSSWYEAHHHLALPTQAYARARQPVTCHGGLPHGRDDRAGGQLVVHMSERLGASSALALGDWAPSLQGGLLGERRSLVPTPRA